MDLFVERAWALKCDFMKLSHKRKCRKIKKKIGSEIQESKSSAYSISDKLQHFYHTLIYRTVVCVLINDTIKCSFMVHFPT